MNKIDILKEKRDLKVLVIIRNILLFITFFLGVLVFCLESQASPMRDDSVSANLTIKVVKDYIDNKVAQDSSTGNVLVDNADAILNGIDNLKSMLPDEIQAFVGPAGYASPIVTDEFLAAYENNDLSYFELTFDLQSTSDLSNLDDYLSKYSQYIVNSIHNDVISYYPFYLNELSSFTGNYTTSNGSLANDISRDINEQLFDSDLYPVLFYRNWRNFSVYSLKNFNGGVSSVDGYVLRSSGSVNKWDFFVSNFDYIRQHGHLPDGYSYEYEMIFDVYVNGVYYNGNITQNKINSPSSSFLVNRYDYYSSEGTTRECSAFFVPDGSQKVPVLFFSNSSSFLKFYNASSKSILPYDFNLMFPNTDFSTLDFSQILKAIRDNGVLETSNIQELYKRLNETLEQGIQDIIDAQKTTNELLLALLRYYEKNIVKDGKNITSILLDINENIKSISSPDEEEISQYLDTIIEDSSLENRLKHIFPFGVFQDIKDLTDKLDEVTVLEPRWDFRLNVGLFEEKYVDYSIDLTSVPEIDTFRSFWFFFILLSFNLLCLGIEYKFLCMFMGGGD